MKCGLCLHDTGVEEVNLKFEQSECVTFRLCRCHRLQLHQQRNFGALTPCSGALMPAVLLLPLGAPVLSGRQDATRPERWHPGAQISAISDPFWAFSDEFVAPTVAIAAFQIVTLPLRAPVAPEALEASYLPC